MKFRHLPVHAAVLMGLSGWAQAQSLVELYDAARGYDATYQSAKAQMDATLSKTDQAIAGILPTVTSTAGVSRSNIVGLSDAWVGTSTSATTLVPSASVWFSSGMSAATKSPREARTSLLISGEPV